MTWPPVKPPKQTAFLGYQPVLVEVVSQLPNKMLCHWVHKITLLLCYVNNTECQHMYFDLISHASKVMLRFLRRQVRWSGIPISWRISHSFLWSTQSKAMLKLCQWSRSRCFSGILLVFLWSSGCWQFDLWFICLFYIQLVHLDVLGSCTAEA